jgi:molybdate transport system substrate-binding protein
MLKNKKIIILIIIQICIFNPCLPNEKINIAVAANFLTTIKKICYFFEKKYNGYLVVLSSDSTSNLFTKIKNNAPFNIFVSANTKHTEILAKSNFYKNKNQTYAIGKITLSKNNTYIKKQTLRYIKNEKFLTISNPKLSPYGKSSEKVILNLKIHHKKIILASNINHTFNFINNNTCNIGIISFSQNIQNKDIKNVFWKIPKYLYPKIKQKTILIQNDKNKISEKFLKLLKKKYIKKLIKKNGYK